jgi:hypothetical protein
MFFFKEIIDDRSDNQTIYTNILNWQKSEFLFVNAGNEISNYRASNG